jgi:hypothetical protein
MNKILNYVMLTIFVIAAVGSVVGLSIFNILKENDVLP